MIPESTVREALAYPYDHEWTIQGLGMLRTYLDDSQTDRLHIWDLDEKFPDASTVHDHPWDFSSMIYAGALRNQRYLLDAPAGLELMTSQIRCGMGGGLVGAPRLAVVGEVPPEDYHPGEGYWMDAPELHESFPEPGTVTVIHRVFAGDRDHATVCWPKGEQWGTAEPRPATREEVDRFVAKARLRLTEL